MSDYVCYYEKCRNLRIHHDKSNVMLGAQIDIIIIIDDTIIIGTHTDIVVRVFSELC